MALKIAASLKTPHLGGRLDMRCPSCGAIIKKRTMKCPECGAFRDIPWISSEPSKSEPPDLAENVKRTKTARSNGSSSLIAFPGTAKSTVPEWRKELGDRVREVQERRAREAALEREQMPVDEEAAVPQLELLPKAELPPVNPLVAAALQRIERAHTRPQYSGNVAIATVPEYEERPEIGIGVSLPEVEFNGTMIVEEEAPKVNETLPPPEKVHNLAVVPAAMNTADTTPTPKPKRLIRDDNDPALNYLDSIPTMVKVDVARHQSAPVSLRFISGFVDLFVITLLTSPVFAFVQYNGLNWQETRALVFLASTFVVLGFLYLTVSTALTGRTMGMRLLSLRVVDARTGLIPTGGQSAKRALAYLLSLAPAGIALGFTFIDREKQAPHDRFSRTAVVRV